MSENNSTTNPDVSALTSLIDSLSDEQQTLLVQSSLASIENTLNLIRTSDPVLVPSLAAMASGLARVAAYTQSEGRKYRGFTATGDTKVDDVFDLYRQIFEQAILSSMTPEEIAEAEATAKEIRQIAETTGRAEADVLAETLAKRRPVGFAPQEPATKSSVGEPPAYGQYL